MTNCDVKHAGDKIVITIDVSKAARDAAKPSSTGKTLNLASTHGFTRFGDVGLSLNCTLPNPAAPAKA